MSAASEPSSDMFAVFPAAPPTELVRFLDLGGYKWHGSDQANEIVVQSDETGSDETAEAPPTWAGALVTIDERREEAWRFCRELRKRDAPIEPLLVLLGGDRLDDLQSRADLFDDFIITPFHPQELEARLQHQLLRAGRGVRPELITYGPLTLNVETYQAMFDDRHLDLTFMEYELLRFLASSPGQVFTRETLLSRVWGYEYFGGARTVDVHIRRLRAKMGEEHSSLIATVRGVGYKLGQSRWTAGGEHR